MRTERVRFSRGEIESRVTAQIARGASVRYLVNARRGQILSAEASGGGDSYQICTLAVYAPGRSVRASNAAPSELGERTGASFWRGTLSRSGDYQVVVSNAGPSGTCYARFAVE